jgi:hypothetical protein
LINQFVAEGVFVPDIAYEIASPIVIVHKNDGGIRMAVDYREVNQQLDTTANQLPYQSTLFQNFEGQKYFAFFGGYSDFWHAHSRSVLHRENIKLEWPMWF